MKSIHWWMFRVQPGIRNKPKPILIRLPGSSEHICFMMQEVQRLTGGRPSKRRLRREIGRLKGKK